MNKPVASKVYIKLTEFLFRCIKADVNFNIAKVLIERIDDFPEIFIEEIAYSANTTPASVTKFCKKLGYASFKEMRSDLIEYSESWLLDNISEQKSSEIMLRRFLEKDRKIEDSIFKALNHQQCTEIAGDLARMKKIAIFGSTHSSAGVNLFRELLSQEGLIVYELHRRAENEIIYQILQEVDAVFFISLTGEWIFQNESLLAEAFKAKKYLLTYQEKALFPNGFQEIISFNNFDFLLESNYYSQKIIRSWIILLAIFIKNNH